MKSIKEWLETLPEPYGTEALREYAVRGKVREKQLSLHDALFCGFPWASSPQGDRYWRDVHRRAKAGEFDQPAELEALRKENAALKAQLAPKEPLKVGDRVRVELPSMEGHIRKAWGDSAFEVVIDGFGYGEWAWLKHERLTRIG